MFQGGARRAAHQIFVVHDQDGPGTGFWLRPTRRSRACADSTGRQQHRESAAQPSRLSTPIAPRWLRTMPSAADSPKPRPVNLVVKNGSKICGCRVRSCRSHRPKPAPSRRCRAGRVGAVCRTGSPGAILQTRVKPGLRRTLAGGLQRRSGSNSSPTADLRGVGLDGGTSG